jgi:hypothetical protein
LGWLRRAVEVVGEEDGLFDCLIAVLDDEKRMD